MTNGNKVRKQRYGSRLAVVLFETTGMPSREHRVFSEASNVWPSSSDVESMNRVLATVAEHMQG